MSAYYEGWQNDFYDDEERDDYEDDRERDEGCCLGAACLNPNYDHFADECYDLEMAQQLFAEQYL